MFSAQDILRTVLLIPGILLGFTFHEYAHAFVADRLGDKTPKFQGRLTLNPLAHIDLFGFIMILIFKFGWAKPVQTNPSAFKNYYKDDLKVSIAGVVGNLFVAFVSAIILGLFLKISLVDSSVLQILKTILLYAIEMNVLLVILNLLPLPGFDGFYVLRDLFPSFFYKIEGNMYRYQLLILFLFIFPIPGIGSSVISLIISGPITVVTDLFLRLSFLIA